MGAVVSGEMIGWLAFWAGACGGGRGAKSVDPEVLIQLGEGFNSRESSDVYLDSPKVKTSDGLITEGWWGGEGRVCNGALWWTGFPLRR